jgi:hypothetical protein
MQMTCPANVSSERSGLPAIAIIRAVNSRDVAIVTGYGGCAGLANDRSAAGESRRISEGNWLLRLDSNQQPSG